MADLASIFNLALGHVGEATQVVDPDESTTVARTCRRFWDQARDAVLSDHPWQFARRVVTAVAYTPVPTGWSYAYLLPSDLLSVRGLNPAWVDAWTTAPATYWWTDSTGAIYSSSDAINSLTTPVTWALGGATDEDGLDTPLLLCDAELGSLVYTRRVEDTSRYPPPFVDAVAYRLAFDLAVPLSGSTEIRSLLWTLYQQRLGNAAVMDARQRLDRRMPDAESIRERGF